MSPLKKNQVTSRALAILGTLNCLTLFAPNSQAALTVLVDHVGYESSASKRALIMATAGEQPNRFELIDSKTNKVVFSAVLTPSHEVKNWRGRVFWTADFSSWKKPGDYILAATSKTDQARSCSFDIDNNLLEQKTLSNAVFYFKGQRSSGPFDRADRHLAVPGQNSMFVDVHGGWYDATGDYGIHLSHQNLTSYFNPQQVPLVAWTCLKSYLALGARKDDNFSEYERRLLDEGMFGADYLVRLKRPEGSFFESITAPGPESWRKIGLLEIQTGVPRSSRRQATPLSRFPRQPARMRMKRVFAPVLVSQLPPLPSRALCRMKATSNAQITCAVPKKRSTSSVSTTTNC